MYVYMYVLGALKTSLLAKGLPKLNKIVKRYQYQKRV